MNIELGLQISKEMGLQKRLSKRLRGQCENACSRSRLVLVDGNFDGQILKARQLKPVLFNAHDPLLEPSTQLRFQANLPKAVGSLLFTGGMLSQYGYIEGIGGMDYENLISIAINLANPDEKKDEVVIRTVFGATELMPLRALSYLLPPLILMEVLKNEGLAVPQLQVVFANQISARLNGLDIDRVMDQSKKLAKIASSYIRTFFPETSASTIFLQDVPLEKGSVLRNELLNNAAILREVTHLEFEDILREKASNNGSGRAHIFYGAAHPILHDADFKDCLSPIIDDHPQMTKASVIISIGGYQERDFYGLRHALKPYLGTAYNEIDTLQFFTKHRVPPYYMARRGDLSLDDALSNKTVDKVSVTAQHDLDYLRKISAFREDFPEFLEEQRKIVT